MEGLRRPLSSQPAQDPPHSQEAAQPEYEPPQVVTYRGEEILGELGPAQACSFNHSVVICP
jgi:hypothetical protein